MAAEFHLKRFSGQKEDTLGLFLGTACEFMCFTIEDEYRTIKVAGETRIPAGRYKLELRKEGGFHQKYIEKFNDKLSKDFMGADWHQGMVQLKDVPGFDYVLIHIGNTDMDTKGCILVGDSCVSNLPFDKGSIGNSTQAYKRIYPVLLHSILSGDAYLTITDDL